MRQDSPSPDAPVQVRRALLGCGMALGLGGLAAGLLAQGRPLPERMRILEERETQFGRISAVELGRKRYLAFGPGRHLVYQSVIDLDRPHELEAPYTRLMMLGAVYAERHARMVQIGVGAGNMAGYAVRTFPSTVVHAVDIDADIVELGAKYFGLAPHPNLRLHIDDGRRWLASTSESFDIVMLDAYDSQSIPPPLMEPAFFKTVAARLAPGGVVMQNVYMPIVDTLRLLSALRTAFVQIDVYKVGQSAVLACYEGPRRSLQALQDRARALDAMLRPVHSFAEMLDHRAESL